MTTAQSSHLHDQKDSRGIFIGFHEGDDGTVAIEQLHGRLLSLTYPQEVPAHTGDESIYCRQYQCKV